MGRRRGATGLPAGAERLRVRVERWRRTREKRSPMPEGLWKAAAELARVHGVSRIARGLGLDYYSLQGRVNGGEGDAEEGSAFVELDVRSLGEIRCSIELIDGEGSRLVIRGISASELDLLALASAFLGHER